MKILPLLLLMFWYCWCKETIVVKVPNEQNEKTLLSLEQDITISIPLTFCIKFNLKAGLLKQRPIFGSSKLSMYFKFGAGTGKVHINGQSTYFKIPPDHGINPYSWHHLCWKSDGEIQEVFFDGKQWYHGKMKSKSSEKSTLNQIQMGSCYQRQTSSELCLNLYPDFDGELSELNIWSHALTSEVLKNFTNSCGNPEPIPNILNWSNVTSLMITGNNYEKDIKHICIHTNESLPIHQIIDNLQDQDGAVQMCKLFKGDLAHPSTAEKYHDWQGM